MPASKCGECRQPLEEWEAGFCEACWPKGTEQAMKTCGILLESKLRYVNAVIDECKQIRQEAEACKRALAMLPREVKDLTEQDCELINAELPMRCTGNVQRKTPRIMR